MTAAFALLPFFLATAIAAFTGLKMGRADLPWLKHALIAAFLVLLLTSLVRNAQASAILALLGASVFAYILALEATLLALGERSSAQDRQISAILMLIGIALVAGPVSYGTHGAVLASSAGLVCGAVLHTVSHKIRTSRD